MQHQSTNLPQRTQALLMYFFVAFENMHLLLYLILPGFVSLMVKIQTYFNKSMLILIFLVCFVH